MFDDWGKTIQEWMNGSVEGFAYWVWMCIKSAFSYSDMNDSWWITVIGGTVTTKVGGASSTVEHPGMLNVIALAAIPVLVIFIVLQLAMSMWRRSTVGLIRAALAGFFAIPTTYILTGFLFLFIKAGDWLAKFILEVGTDNGEADAMSAILALFGLSWDPANEKVLLDENYQQWAQAKDPNNTGGALPGLVIILITFICAFFLMIMMVFRTYALVVMAVFLPIGVYSLAHDAAKGIFMRWLSVVIGLILAKPAAAVIIKIGLTISSSADEALQLAAGIIGLLVAGMTPIFAATFISFVNNNSHGSMESGGVGAASNVGRQASNFARSARQGIGRAGRGLTRMGRR
ncbi:conjugal transfer protein TrbL family protein [Glutamicibacter arilaitensis]|uniref:conjugal transfer protein TrbL family protein n=1 Tax=Glutamicibacter arilaitensis TaxID=256701 RepID=UPI003FD08A22